MPYKAVIKILENILYKKAKENLYRSVYVNNIKRIINRLIY